MHEKVPRSRISVLYFEISTSTSTLSCMYQSTTIDKNCEFYYFRKSTKFRTTAFNTRNSTYTTTSFFTFEFEPWHKRMINELLWALCSLPFSVSRNEKKLGFSKPYELLRIKGRPEASTSRPANWYCASVSFVHGSRFATGSSVFVINCRNLSGRVRRIMSDAVERNVAAPLRLINSWVKYPRGGSGSGLKDNGYGSSRAAILGQRSWIRPFE